MKLSKYECETIINWNLGEDTGSIYTADSRMWKKFESLPGFKLIRTVRLDGKVISKEFEFPKAYIRHVKNGLMIGLRKVASKKQREHGRRSINKIRAKVTP